MFWTNDSKAPDTSVPVPKNANTTTNFKWLNYLPFSKENIATTEQHLKEEVWRPPRHEEISHAMDAPYKMDDIFLRESWIKAMMLRLVRDQLNACYRDNGVNHYENCAHLSELYLKWMKEGYRVRGGKIRTKIDQKNLQRREFAAKPPPDAPLNRPWAGIGGKPKDHHLDD